MEAFANGTIPNHRKRPSLLLAERSILQLLSAEIEI
jgi:hypothetical protein